MRERDREGMKTANSQIRLVPICQYMNYTTNRAKNCGKPRLNNHLINSLQEGRLADFLLLPRHRQLQFTLLLFNQSPLLLQLHSHRRQFTGIGQWASVFRRIQFTYNTRETQLMKAFSKHRAER